MKMLRKLEVPPPPLARIEMTSASVCELLLYLSVITVVLPVSATRWCCMPLIKQHPAAAPQSSLEAGVLRYALNNISSYNQPSLSDKVACNLVQLRGCG